MSRLGQLVRLRTRELDEKRRTIGILLDAEAELVGEGTAMDRELEQEKRAAEGSLDARSVLQAYMAHFRQRKEALAGRLAEKRAEIEAANEEMLEAYRELRKAEAAEEQEIAREAERVGRLEQMALDDIALAMMARRKR